MEPTPPVLSPPAAGPPSTSLGARLFNVFATPGDVFEEVRQSKPCVGNWLLPMFLSCVIGVISVLVIFSQEAIQHQVIQA